MGFLFPRTHGMVKNSLRRAEASAKPQTIDVMVQKAHLGTGLREIKAPRITKNFSGKRRKSQSFQKLNVGSSPKADPRFTGKPGCARSKSGRNCAIPALSAENPAGSPALIIRRMSGDFIRRHAGTGKNSFR